jgi:hypothetical protein
MGTKTGAFQEEEEEEEEEEKKRTKRERTKINRYLPSKERTEAMHEPARNGKHNKSWQTNAKGQKKRERRSASKLTYQCVVCRRSVSFRLVVGRGRALGGTKQGYLLIYLLVSNN